MDITPNQSRFSHYPTQHVMGILADQGSVTQLCSALEGLGLPGAGVKVFHGEAGRQAFDHHEGGLQGWLERATSLLTGTRQDKLPYIDALEGGQYVVAADIQDQPDARGAVGQAFKAAGAQDVNFLGELVVDPLD